MSKQPWRIACMHRVTATTTTALPLEINVWMTGRCLQRWDQNTKPQHWISSSFSAPCPICLPMCPYCRTPSPLASAALAPLWVSMDTKLTFIMFLPTVVFRKDLINAGAPSRTEQNLSDKVWLQVCDPSREGSPAHSAGRPPEAACDKHHKLLIMDFQRAGSEL